MGQEVGAAAAGRRKLSQCARAPHPRARSATSGRFCAPGRAQRHARLPRALAERPLERRGFGGQAGAGASGAAIVSSLALPTWSPPRVLEGLRGTLSVLLGLIRVGDGRPFAR